MKNNIFTYLSVSTILLTPTLLVFAQGPNSTPGIPNPLKFGSISEVVFGAVDAITSIGFFVAVFFIIYSGFLFVKARGNPTEIKSAKEALLWTVIGTAVLLGARVIADVIQGTLDEIEAREIPAEVIKHV